MNAFVRALETADQHRFTLDDVLRMQEAGILDPDARVELIDGGLVEMSPEGAPHIRAKMQLGRQFLRLADETVSVIIDSTLRLSPSNAPDPDIYLYRSDIPLEAVNGSNVGLIVEIADTTLRSDLGVKAEIYASHGVTEYWVIDLATARNIVHRQPADGRYSDVRSYEATDSVAPTPFPTLAIRLADLPHLR